MEMNQMRRLQAAFAAVGQAASPLGRALCAALGEGPAPAVADLFSQFYRTISNEAPDALLYLSAVHYLALTGEAPRLAPFFPSCGGTFTPADAGALAQAAADDVAAGRDTLLDYLLSRQAAPHLVERSAAVALGALAVADRFGGGVSLVEFGCGGGLNLQFDRYAYRFGGTAAGRAGGLVLSAGLDRAPAFLTRPLPPVAGRYGLDPAPYNPADPGDRAVLESFFFPDDVDRINHLRQAAAMLAEHGGVDIRQGRAESDLLPLLAEAYTAMPEGHTLLVVDTFVWPDLSDPERQAVAWQIQRLAAGLQPRKPLAWLQVEPFATATPGAAELRLHTFGWGDREDRAVRHLAETDPAVSQVHWLE